MASNQPTTQQRRRRRSPVQPEILRHSVALSISTIMSQMLFQENQARCMQLLQINDLSEAYAKIMTLLVKIDEDKLKRKRPTKQN